MKVLPCKDAPTAGMPGRVRVNFTAGLQIFQLFGGKLRERHSDFFSARSQINRQRLGRLVLLKHSKPPWHFSVAIRLASCVRPLMMLLRPSGVAHRRKASSFAFRLVALARRKLKIEACHPSQQCEKALTFTIIFFYLYVVVPAVLHCRCVCGNVLSTINPGK